MDIVLIGGMWLTASAWEQVAADLNERGHRAVPVALPGQGDGATSATLDDQKAAVIAAVDAAAGKPVVVGHSAAATLAWLAADARPDAIATVVFVGSFPDADGATYFSGLPVENGVMPFPGWERFEGPDSADLDQSAREQIAAAMVAVPEGVTSGVVRLADERRYNVPAVLVCPEFTPAQAREWIDQGHAPELTRCKDLSLADLDTGHWPMYSAPGQFASMLSDIAGTR